MSSLRLAGIVTTHIVTDMGREERREEGYRVLGYYKNKDMDKKNWDDSEFQKKIRISEDSLAYIRKITKKGSMARTLEEIIQSHKNYGDARLRSKKGV